MPELIVAFRGRTLLYQARACLLMGKYADALTMLDQAEIEFEGTPFCTNELAQVWYERAALLFKSGDLHGAARQAKRAISVFTLAGDIRRLAKARIIQAGILYERGDIEAARELWLLVIEPLRLVEDFEAVASILLNVGSAETLLGRPDSAKVRLEKALAAFTKLGNHGEAIRTRWSMAKQTLVHEDRSEGLRLLRNVRADFISAEMPAEAGFVSLDLVEQLLEDGNSSDEAIALCRFAIDAFQKAGASRKVIEALAYLRESTRKRTANSELVREVKTYLEQTAQGRDPVFAPRLC